jgi:hypothetical protein
MLTLGGVPDGRQEVVLQLNPSPSYTGTRLCEGFCEDGNEPSGFVKGREFLNWLSDY